MSPSNRKMWTELNERIYDLQHQIRLLHTEVTRLKCVQVDDGGHEWDLWSRRCDLCKMPFMNFVDGFKICQGEPCLIPPLEFVI